MSSDNINIKFDFDVDKNKYILKVSDKTFEFTREKAVELQNYMNRTLKATPQLFNLGKGSN